MSKKSGPLNKAEKFYLDNHDSSVKEFALDLNRSEKVIKTYTLLHEIKKGVFKMN